ncbi:hypothetical protein BLNAU_9058 [Blattamonas nauphoetae]|uniref:Uncharacterized protein n=1 Tax=Blattamonas nauphoetae TaxID=2049346 RepID=A0ABQ9XWN7_9EUKA|nr:hypothetical protein BLNAU_9058 [Blattamonas nauphoetae]
MSRCLSGLGLIEETLGRVLRGLMDEDEEEEDEKMDDGEEERREENGKEDEMERRELEKEVGGMFVRHFGRSVSQRVGKIGVIGIDIGKERFWMKKREEDRTRKNEEKLKHELDEMRRKEEDRQRRMDEMEKEHRQTQAELKQQYEENKLKIKLAEEYKQLKLVEEVERMRRKKKKKKKKRKGSDRPRPEHQRLNGSTVPSSLSAFGPVVVRFTLVIKVKSGCYKLELLLSHKPINSKATVSGYSSNSGMVRDPL